jgi:hypothetical protein
VNVNVDIGDFDKDISSQVAVAVQSGIATRMESRAAQRMVRQAIEAFFVLLMRLDDTPLPGATHQFPTKAHIQDYVIDGQRLIVRFYSVPRQDGTLPPQQ